MRSESATVPPMEEKIIEAVKAAAKRAVGRNGVYFLVLVDEDDAEILTNIHKADVAEFIRRLPETIEGHDKLLRMPTVGSA